MIRQLCSSIGKSRRKYRRLQLIVLIAFSLFKSTASCPNLCSGHGSCGLESTCDCVSGWNVVPDCSQHRCPSSPAWNTKPYSLDEAHGVELECGGVGVCNRKTGNCMCEDGFTGKNHGF